MDIALESVGSHGKYQKTISFLIIVVGVLSLLMSSSFPFMTKRPDLLCKEKESLEGFHPCPENDLCKNDFFDYKKDLSTSLYNWSYEFDFYCDNNYVPPFIGTTFFFGGIIGSVVLSPLPDKYGRQSIYKILLIIIFILNLNVFLTINKWHLILVNALLGIASFAYSMTTVIITEYIDRSYAGMIMSLTSAIFPLSGILVALLFMFINNWRFLFFISSILSFLCVYISQKYFLESPRWLNSKNRFNETLDVFKQIAIINDSEENYQKFLSVNSKLINKTSSTLKEIKKFYSIFQIFEFNSQRETLIILSYIWFTIGFCFYGLILNLEHLGKDLIFNSIITFTSEIISELFSGYLADEYGRLFVLKYLGFIGGFGFILYELIPSDTIKTIFIFVTSFGFAAVFNVVFIYSPEIFPTSIRSTVMGYLYFISRLGALLVPSVSAVIPRVPFVFGILSIISSYLCYRLPETLGREIEDDMPEVIRQKSFLSTSNNAVRRSKKLSNRLMSKLSFNKAIVSDYYFKIEETEK